MLAEGGGPPSWLEPASCYDTTTVGDMCRGHLEWELKFARDAKCRGIMSFRDMLRRLEVAAEENDQQIRFLRLPRPSSPAKRPKIPFPRSLCRRDRGISKPDEGSESNIPSRNISESMLSNP